MNRREALQRVSLMMGGALSASSVTAVLTGLRTADAAGYKPQPLSAAQDDLVATLVELIIPTTDTPGAQAAGVNRYIDGMLTSIYTETERAHFLSGLTDLEARAKATGAAFLASSVARQTEILKELEAE